MMSLSKSGKNPDVELPPPDSGISEEQWKSFVAAYKSKKEVCSLSPTPRTCSKETYPDSDGDGYGSTRSR